MTNDEMRIAIAEHQGWVWYRIPNAGTDARKYRCLFLPAVHETDGQLPAWLVRADMTERICNLEYLWREGLVPNFPGDLNAMHQAIIQLSGNQRDLFNTKLCEITAGGFDFSELYDLDASINATAAQRAEAFLRTVGKWKEAQ